MGNKRDRIKRVGDLTPSDFQDFPVWEYLLDQEDEDGEPTLHPVRSLPVNSLANRLVGMEASLNNGSRRWATLGCLDLVKPEHNEHFLMVSIWHGGRWVHLRRYHDAEYTDAVPATFAAALGLQTCDVFPISYDVSTLVVGVPEALKGVITALPKVRLPQDVLIQMALAD